MELTTRPSRVRFLVLAFLGSLVFILYLDRVCIGKAGPRIAEELGISMTGMGWVYGIFTVSYGLFEVPAGRWGDRYGSRGVLTRIVCWWSAFTILTGCVPRFAWHTGITLPWTDKQGEAIELIFGSLALMMLVRFLFGAGEAGALPNNARVIAHWFPLRERSLVQGIIITAMQLGGASSPILAGYLIKYAGWRWSFAIFGSIGVVWAAIFYWWFRDEPGEHPAVNSAERDLIHKGRGDLGGQTHAPIPWRFVLRSRNIWLLGTIMACSAFVSYMYMSWYPTYLQKARHVSETDSGWLTGMVLGGGALGSMFGGWLSSNIERWTGQARWGRGVMGCVYLMAASFLVAGSVYCDSAVAASVCGAAACFCIQSQQPNWWSSAMAISGRHLGALFGLMNSMGIPGSFGSQIFFGHYADSRAAAGFTERAIWDPGFFVYATVMMAGGICWLFVDPTRSAVEPDDRGT